METRINSVKGIKAWHFLDKDCRLRFGKRTLVKPGETYRATGDLKLCYNGMHASKRIRKAASKVD